MFLVKPCMVQRDGKQRYCVCITYYGGTVVLYNRNLHTLVTHLIDYLVEYHFDEVVNPDSGNLQHINTWFVTEEQPEHSQLGSDITDIEPLRSVDSIHVLRMLQSTHIPLGAV